MENLGKGMGSLLLNPRYSDLEIRCEGRSYLVHRLIVCSNSPVLAQECEGREPGNIVIEHNTSDALTLERMLLFMYKGDYTVKVLEVDATEVAVETESSLADEHESSPAQPAEEGESGAAEESIPSHAEENSDPTCQALERIEERQTIILDSAVAHVLVYVLASQYEMPDLQDLAFQRFKARLPAVAAEDYAEVARRVYSSNLSCDGEALSAEIFTVALERVDELMDCQTFVQTLLGEPELQRLAGDLLPAVVERAKGRNATIETLELDVAKQRKKLDGLKEDLLSAKGRARDHAERENAVALKLSVVQAELEIELCKSVEADRRYKAKAKQASEREAELKRELASSKNEKNILKLSFAEQHRELQAAITKLDGFSGTPAAIDRSAADRDTWREKYYKRDRALRDIVATVNKWTHCRNEGCSDGISVWLDWDDRSASDDRGL
ncbi:hypothetical protein B0A55_02797 [Friedmanniomyces simplex]|uniref:BTB domain-containing protein n=1 Tax=Friedmanniomyces simplex TaxID=329884 RepID=A0A4U0XQR6_9PEZI|nr:hypothetical protein B0A55_02797 [Friedmanniomyces simplex]